MTRHASHRLTVLLLGIVLASAAVLPADPPRLAATMYSSRRAAKRGDLIRVIVQESTSSSKEHSKNTSKDFSATAAEGQIGNANSTAALPKALNLTLPGYNLSGSAEFAGSGDTATSESLTASLTAQVTDVLPNGILVIHGERLVTLGKEEVRMILSGMVRRRDVTTTNTVLSSQVADARIRYVSTGEVTRGSSPGWLARVFQFINPF
jgi:flagellar L-ring protein precursor FlgH